MPSITNALRRWLTFLIVIALGAGLLVAGPASLAQEGQDLNPGPATPSARGPAVPPEVTDHADDWPVAQGNLKAHRAAASSSINAANVSELEVAWRFAIEADYTWGGMTAPPLVLGDTVYLQDMRGNVFAVDRESGELRWERIFDQPTPGPNGLAVGYGLIYGGLGDSAEVFALDIETGEEVWRVQLSNNASVGVTQVPTVHDNVVYIGTTPGTTELYYQGGGKGILYALDAQTGVTLWEFDTTTDNLWGKPRINSGGGLWYPLSIDDDGNLYFGTGNPGPWPGIESELGTFPNGSSRPGPNDYASSMVSLDPTTGAVRWHHNAKPHDLFDLDFQLTPILTTLTIHGIETDLAIGGGKTGTVIAADANTGAIIWETAVGIHENDHLQEIPEGETVRVYPGSLGGVETSMAYANGTVFVPLLNLYSMYTATTQEGSQPFNEATGELVALNAADGSVIWEVQYPVMNIGAATVANDVVFTATMDGVVRAHNAGTGQELWTYQLGAGVNAPMAIAGDMVIVPAGAPRLGGGDGVEGGREVVAFRLAEGEAVATPAADDAATPATEATPDPAATPVDAAADATPDDGAAAAAVDDATPVDAAATPSPADLPAGASASIISGSCEAMEDEAAFELEAPALPEGEAEGLAGAHPAMISSSSIETSLDDLLAGAYAVRVADEGGDALVCGDVGGVPRDGNLAVTLIGQDDSRFFGVAWFRDLPEGGVQVDLYVAEGLLTPAGEVPGAPDEGAAETPEPGDGEAPAATPADADAEAAAERVEVEAVDIDFNPNELTIPAGTEVTIVVTNTGATLHTFTIDELGIDEELQPGDTVEIPVNAEAGEYVYYCTVPGHREAGQEGTLIVQ